MTAGAIVHIVDDDPAVLKSLVRLLRAAGFDAQAHPNAKAFLEDFNTGEAGCVILDRHMPEICGHAVHQWLSKKRACLPVIFLTGEADIASSVQAIKCGAIDYLTKPVEPDVLLRTVCLALDLDEIRRKERAEADEFALGLDSLTAREREVVNAAVAGRLNKQIAHDLDIVEKTVKVHRARAMRKMGARNLADLVSMVVSHRTTDALDH